jgi:hypothetical protein
MTHLEAEQIAKRAWDEAFADEDFRLAFHERVQQYAQALLGNLRTPPRKPRQKRRRKAPR